MNLDGGDRGFLEQHFGSLAVDIAVIKQSIEHFGHRVDAFVAREHRTEEKLDALEDEFALHIKELVTRNPYERMLVLEDAVSDLMRLRVEVKFAELEKRAAILESYHRDGLTVVRVLRSQWAALVAGGAMVFMVFQLLSLMGVLWQ